MDRVITRNRWTRGKVFLYVLGLSLIVLLLYFGISQASTSRMKVERQRLRIEKVEKAIFQDYISVNGRVEPMHTVFLDAVEGGMVEEILIEEGSTVKKGDIIARLSNTNLQLTLMNHEAQLAEQMNNLRNTRLMMEQNRLDLRRQLLEVDYELRQSRRDYLNSKSLHEKKLIADTEYQNLEDDFRMLTERRLLLKENIRQDSLFRAVQIEQLEASVQRLQSNLSIIRQKADGLSIKAPIDGLLASMTAELGVAMGVGQRVGYIYETDRWKIRADIDEHYVTRISTGLKAVAEQDTFRYPIQLGKVYPEVKNGYFKADFFFAGDLPPDLKIGRSFLCRVELGDSAPAVLLPKGGFMQVTGGQWVFVLNPDGKTAERREIKLGRQNPEFYEVLEGLGAGDAVIVSGYDLFKNVTELILTQ